MHLLRAFSSAVFLYCGTVIDNISTGLSVIAEFRLVSSFHVNSKKHNRVPVSV